MGDFMLPRAVSHGAGMAVGLPPPHQLRGPAWAQAAWDTRGATGSKWTHPHPLCLSRA